MRTAILRAGLLTIGSALLAQDPVTDGPFGIRMGQTAEEIALVAGELKPVDLQQGLYLLSKVPKPHNSFEAYGVVLGTTTGVCEVRAIGKDISTSSHGIQLMSAFNAMRDQLRAVYGQSEDSDFLLPGSMWHEPEYWMMSLLQKERLLSAKWSTASGSTLKNGISGVLLTASAKDSSTGYLLLYYEFQNHEACVAELQKKQNEAL